MADLGRFYEECGYSAPKRAFNENNDSITIIRLSRQDESAEIEFEKVTLSGPARQNWLSERTDRPGREVILELLQVTGVRDLNSIHGYLDISSNSFDAVIRRFELEDLIKYATSTLQLISHSSSTTQGQMCTSSCVYVEDYFTQVHKYHHSTRFTQGLYLAGSKVIPQLERAIYHQRALAGHAYFLPVCIAAAFGLASDLRTSEISDELARVERRTGFNVWELSRFEPAEGDLHTLTARLSGYGTSLAANKRLNQLTKNILGSCDTTSMNVAGDASETEDKKCKEIATHVNLLVHRNESQRVLIDFLASRLQNQVTALFNLVTQLDTKISISLSEDSRMIAEASKHDSSSMKTLAAVTVVFLPGTFIASLFSISMFDWQADADGSVLNERFWIYWAVSLPLTFVTILAWYLWTRLDLLSYRKHETKIRAESLENIASLKR